MLLKMAFSYEKHLFCYIAVQFLLPYIPISNSIVINFSLNGTWSVVNQNKGLSIPGLVPGNVYTALLTNKTIDDPYYMFNDVAYRWIGEDDWTYMRTFEVSAELLAQQRIVLVCEGLDTVATVFVNGHDVGHAKNMFVQYIFDVKSVLKSGTNTISVAFQSPVAYSKAQADASPYKIPPECPSTIAHGECHANMIRKEQCSFSWDWGPSFPTTGIWRNIWLQGYNSVVLRYVTAETVLGPGDPAWNLLVDIFFEVMSSDNATGILEIVLVSTGVAIRQEVTVSRTADKVSVSMDVPQSSGVETWWPNGYGKQTLYTLQVKFTDIKTLDLSAGQIKVGFRTVELIQEPLAQGVTGLTYFFKINGEAIFLKGSNWIPGDSFDDRVTRDRLENVLGSAAAVHMNALRVWGGGVYESSDFYDLADELGILIWQDLMFACAMYPSDEEFLDTVQQEIRHQVRRLKHHPSILVWAGNNENEAALAGNWYNTAEDYKQYYSDYIKLYIDTIYPLVSREDTSRAFVSSSPSNAKESAAEGWVAKNPYDWHYGDDHFYNDVVDLWDPKNYPIPRMATEYGFQSWCSLESVSKVAESSQWEMFSNWTMHRQHHPLGNIVMEGAILLHFQLPNSTVKQQKFDDILYLTQVNQAMTIRFETEHYRRFQSQLINSTGMTMGALYWQLNDIWQAPSWASIEYSGRWKMLHYYAQNFFAPTLISPYLDDDTLKVYIVVDKLPQNSVHRLRSGAKYLTYHMDIDTVVPKVTEVKFGAVSGVLYVQIFSWSSMTAFYTWTVNYTLTTPSQLVYEANIDSMLKISECKERAMCFIYAYLDRGVSAWLQLSVFNNPYIKRAAVKITNVRQNPASSRDFILTVTTNEVAPFVWLEAPGVRGRFTENGFLIIQPQKTVHFYAWQDVDLQTLISALKIRSLMDVYPSVV